MAEVIDLVSDEEVEEHALIPPPFGREVVNPFEARVLHHHFDFKLHIIGKPKAWQRRKVYHRQLLNRWIHNHVDTNRSATRSFRVRVLQKLGELITFPITPQFYPITEDGPVYLELEFHRRIPNSAFIGGKRTNQLKEAMGIWQNKPDTNKPDLDNLVKFVKDALQGIIYKDDQQVVKVVATKSWDLTAPHDGRTVIKVRNAGPTDMPYGHDLIPLGMRGII